MTAAEPDTAQGLLAIEAELIIAVFGIWSGAEGGTGGTGMQNPWKLWLMKWAERSDCCWGYFTLLLTPPAPASMALVTALHQSAAICSLHSMLGLAKSTLSYCCKPSLARAAQENPLNPCVSQDRHPHGASSHACGWEWLAAACRKELTGSRQGKSQQRLSRDFGCASIDQYWTWALKFSCQGCPRQVSGLCELTLI